MGPERKEEFMERYREQFMNPYLTAARGYVDEVIAPEDTRKRIAAALEAFAGKHREPCGKRHGNIPL